MPVARFVLVAGICLFLFPLSVHAEVDDAWRQKSENWLQLAELVVVYVEKGKYVEAREQVAQLSQEFSKANLSTKKLNIEAVHILSDQLVRMEQQLNQVVISNPEQLQRNALRLKLSFDAVSHPNQPLWKQYYQPLKQRIARFYQAEKQQNKQEMIKAIQAIDAQYQLIRPAVGVSKKAETMAKLDSLIRFMNEQKESKLQKVGVKRLEQVIDPLFFGSDEDVLHAYQPYVGSGVEIMVIWVCFWIMVIFAYVSFKKYRLRRSVANKWSS